MNNWRSIYLFNKMIVALSDRFPWKIVTGKIVLLGHLSLEQLPDFIYGGCIDESIMVVNG